MRSNNLLSKLISSVRRANFCEFLKIQGLFFFLLRQTTSSMLKPELFEARNPVSVCDFPALLAFLHDILPLLRSLRRRVL